MSAEITRYTLLCGLTPLIPIPFLDEWVERNFRRHLYKAVAAKRGITLDEPALDVLTEDRASMLVGCLVIAVKWPVKKLFRTIFYFLTIKDVIDYVTRAAHYGAMLDAAIVHGALPTRSREVRADMDITLDRFHWSPVSRFLTGSERPDTEWIAGEDSLARTVTGLFRMGGGGPLLAAFRKRLGEDR